MTADWTVAPHPVPLELEPDYHAEPYTEPTRWATIEDKLDKQTLAQLREIGRYGIGDSDAHT